MTIGTKSLLFGVHQFILHPIFTALGWIKCYGWNNKGYSWWKLIICFIIHDWGYWECPNMDGEEGETHVEWAHDFWLKRDHDFQMATLCLFHSRFFAAQSYQDPSELCWADKAGTALMPVWLWILLCKLTGELEEYKSALKHKEKLKIVGHISSAEYFKRYKEHIKELIDEHCN